MSRPSTTATLPPIPNASGNLYPLNDLPLRPWMPKRNGKAINRLTVLRWALHGKGGRKLETLMVGGTRCTSDLWAWQFFQHLTDAGGGTPRAMTPSQQMKDHLQATAELAAAGIR